MYDESRYDARQDTAHLRMAQNVLVVHLAADGENAAEGKLNSAQHDPHSEVPPHMCRGVTGGQLFQGRLQAIAGRQQGVTSDPQHLVARIVEIKGENAVDHTIKSLRWKG